MVMFMRYIHMTVQNFKAQSVAVVVEISERSNCVKLPDTDSTSCPTFLVKRLESDKSVSPSLGN